MTAQTGNYNVPLYAATSLIALENAIGLPKRIHRGYDEERRAHGKGDTIKIRGPGEFVVVDAPASSAQELDVRNVDLTLSYFRETRFELTDRDVAINDQKILNDHIPRAIYAIANDIDVKCWSDLYAQVPWVDNQAGATMAQADITKALKILTDNKAPQDMPGMFHFGIGTKERMDLQNLAAFSQWQGAGNSAVAMQQTGVIEEKYGFQFFFSQNRPTHVGNAVADGNGTLDGTTVAKGLTSILVNAVTPSAVFKKGDTFVIAGNIQRYSIAADATASGGGAVTLTISNPGGLVQAYGSGAAVTIDTQATQSGQNLAFHSHFAAFATGRLPDYSNIANRNGDILVVEDPRTGLSLRTSLWFDPGVKKLFFGVDCLFGFKVINPNLAMRSRG